MLVTGILAGVLALPASHPNRQDTAPNAADIAERAAKVYQALSSFRANFRQVIDDSMIGSFESRGKLIQTGTSKLSMRFSDPAGEAIVMDGKQVWVYTPSTTPGQVLRLPLPSGPTFGPNVLAWLLDHPSERYTTRYVREDLLESRPVDVIALTPRDSTLPFQRAVLWIDRTDALPRRLQLQERSGARRTLTLSRVEINVPVAARTFTFVVPPGVRIIEAP